jgi:hypothetical protein
MIYLAIFCLVLESESFDTQLRKPTSSHSSQPDGSCTDAAVQICVEKISAHDWNFFV